MFGPAAKSAQFFFKHINPNPKLCAAGFPTVFFRLCAINTVRIQISRSKWLLKIREK